MKAWSACVCLALLSAIAGGPFAAGPPTPRKATGPADVGAKLDAVFAKLADTAFTREQALLDLEEIVRSHGWHEDGKRAAAAARLLRKMVREGEERRRRPPRRPTTKEERIAELIYRLRDQPAWLCSLVLGFRGSYDFFGGGETPASQLVAFGYEAVPQLLPALEDERFCRAVVTDFTKSGRMIVVPLRVGDCSLAILQRIAGRSFGKWGGRYVQESLFECGNASVARAARKEVKAWWRDFQKKGEKRMLIEGTEAGDGDSPEQAQRLVARYPDAALEPLLKVLERTKDTWARQGLLAAASEVPNPQVVGLFLRELKGPSLQVRLIAARALHSRGRPEGARAMISEWLRLTKPPAGTGPLWPPEPTDSITTTFLIEFLLTCGSPEAVSAVRQGLRGRQRDFRFDVMWACWSEEVRPEWEALFIDCLDYAAPATSYCTSAKNCPDARPCDFAADALARHWGQPALFDLFTDVRTRDRGIVALRNVWRARHNEPQLPLPKR